MIFIPLYLGIRIAVERVDSNPDLLYISTLTPGRIIRGKFFCGAYMAVLVLQRLPALHGIHEPVARRGSANGVLHPVLPVPRCLCGEHAGNFSGVPAHEAGPSKS
ncbi:MAG: hypothetical protein WDM80_17685 [Limisphaerales bacterium]